MNSFLGGFGAGGTALVLTTGLVLSTRANAEHKAKKPVAMALGLATGLVWASAGQIWGMPDDWVLSAVHAAGVNEPDGPLGKVTMPAVSFASVLVVYLVPLKSRAAGVAGIVMATLFASSGGSWAMVAETIRDFVLGIAS